MNALILVIVAAGATVVLVIYYFEVIASVLRDLTHRSTKDKANRRARELLRRHRSKTRGRDEHSETGD